MAERREFIVNSTLLVLIVSLTAYLVYDVRRSRGALEYIGRNDQTNIDKVIKTGGGIVTQGPFDAALFNENNPFDAIVTAIPTATSPPKPSPTPTELPTPAWQVIAIMEPVVQIRDKFGKFHYLKVGDTLEQFLIVKTDQAGDRILVRNVEFGNEKWLLMSDERKSSRGAPGTPGAPRRPRAPR